MTQGNLPTDVTYVLTTTSYEGSLMVPEAFPGLDHMDLLFPDHSNIDQTIENYLQTFNQKVGVELKRTDLTFEQQYILATHIYGVVF